MQYVIYASHLRTCLFFFFRAQKKKKKKKKKEHVSEMVLKTVLRHPSTSLPHLKHLIQLVRSLVETLRPEVGQKR